MTAGQKFLVVMGSQTGDVGAIQFAEVIRLIGFKQVIIGSANHIPNRYVHGSKLQTLNEKKTSRSVGSPFL